VVAAVIVLVEACVNVGVVDSCGCGFYGGGAGGVCCGGL